MHFNCNIPTSQVIFHSSGLELNTAKLNITSDIDEDVRLPNQTYHYDNQTEFVLIHLNKYCIKNITYALTVHFTGNISEKLFGFYKSNYTQKNITY
jgi:hypothetical protein